MVRLRALCSRKSSMRLDRVQREFIRWLTVRRSAWPGAVLESWARPMTCKWRAFPLRFRLDLPLLALLTFAFVACEVAGALALEGRLRVVPVLFIPSDNSEIDGGKVAAYRDLIRSRPCCSLPWSRQRRARLIEARSSQDLACCARAIASARSKWVCAFASSRSGDLSAISPAVRWTSASGHLSLVASIIVIASRSSAKRYRLVRVLRKLLLNVTSAMAQRLMLLLTALRRSRMRLQGRRPRPCRSELIPNLGAQFRAASSIGAFFVRQRDDFI